MCIFWGTTYLGIRIALEFFAPVTLVALRYLISGGVLLIGARVTGAHLPRGRELWLTALNGLLTIGIGNGALSFSEQWIPSGLAALFIVLSPFWMVGIEALIPGGEPLHWPAIAGLVVGLVGIAALVTPAEWRSPAVGGAFLLLQLGCAGWALGSILQRNQKTRAHPFTSGGVQQMATGLVYGAIALFAPTPHWNARGVSAILYLAIFGGIIGYSSYLYAIEHLPIAVASIYTYINPIVAVALGWLFYREPFGTREAAAMVLVFAGVAIVKAATSRRALK